jgi:hypothetical protein
MGLSKEDYDLIERAKKIRENIEGELPLPKLLSLSAQV